MNDDAPAFDVDPVRLTKTLTELATRLEPLGDLETIYPLVGSTACAFFGVSGAGVLIEDGDGTLREVAASDATAVALERIQADAGEGPCVEAFATGQDVHVVDMAMEERWPGVSGALSDAGVRGLLGTPIRIGVAVVGSLNVFDRAPRRWGDNAEAAVHEFRRLLEERLSYALHAHQRGERAQQLQRALDTRVLVDRAIGVMMERHGLEPLDAFNRIRTEARTQRRRVHDVCAEILSTALHPPLDRP